MAPPRKPVDELALRKFAERLWPNEEIAAALGVSVSLLAKRYKDVIEECRHRGKSNLRDLQWKRALAGSDKMIIHMSKHQIGQHDKIESTITSQTEVVLSPELTEILAQMKKEMLGSD